MNILHTHYEVLISEALGDVRRLYDEVKLVDAVLQKRFQEMHQIFDSHELKISAIAEQIEKTDRDFRYIQNAASNLTKVSEDADKLLKRMDLTPTRIGDQVSIVGQSVRSIRETAEQFPSRRLFFITIAAAAGISGLLGGGAVVAAQYFLFPPVPPVSCPQIIEPGDRMHINQKMYASVCLVPLKDLKDKK